MRKVSDGNYGSFEYGEWFESPIEADTDVDKALDALEANLTKRVEKRVDKFLNGQPTVEQIASELGGEVTAFDRGAEATARDYSPAEETPPLPGAAVLEGEARMRDNAEEVRTPMDENGDEYDIFPVERIKITVSDTGTKFAKVFGGRWQKFGVTVWEEVMEGVFPIGDLDVGHEFKPAQALKAKAILNEKGNPKKVVEFV